MMTIRHLFLGALCAAPVCLADFDPKNMDTTAKPSADFYEYADGSWLKNTTIPPDHSTLGSFDVLQDNNEKVLHAIAEKAASAANPGFIEKLVGDFYYSGMDIATVNSAGVTPLKAEFDRIGALQSTADLAPEVARLHRLGAGVCFGFGSEQDPKNSDMMIGGVGQGGLGLPERDYYTRDDDASKKLRDKYVAHVVKMLELAGDPVADAPAEAAAVMRLETALAVGSKTAVDLRDPISNYHLTPIADVAKLTPHFDWNAYFAGMGLATPASVDVGQPDFMKALDAQIVSTPLADWKVYFRWQLIDANAPYLSTPFVDENFAFFGTALGGAPQLRERWMRVISVLDADVGEALGQLYVRDAFPPEAKARALAMVTSILQALHERIQGLDWMDEPTRQAALRKLDAYGVKVGYPDKWIDYSTLAIDRGTYVLNVGRAMDFLVRRDMAKIGKHVDRTEWGMTPPTVNCYYDSSRNEIVFPAGILQPPFFDAKADDALNYGAIGSMMGHEMTHGFDDQGRQYDAKGNLADWWTPESAKRFTERAKAIIKQYSEYVPVDNLHINGELSQGENVADLGGIKLSYTAFMKTPEGMSGVKIDGFTPQQRFFLSFASMYKELDRPEILRLWLQTDPHSPGRYRVIGALSNMDEFAKAFDVPEGSPMRRPAADRVDIW
jgi:predicted metalloendopeptidase